jgi:transcriptional regulator with XRE-family HTH domain
MSPSKRPLPKTLYSAQQRLLRNLMIKARDKAGLTQQQLARRLGKHQSFVAKYEGGERRLDVVEFLFIARALGTDALRMLRILMRKSS